MVEMATDVQTSEMRLVTRAISLNFINQGRGTMIVPTGGVDGRGIKEAWSPYTTEKEFDSYVSYQEPVPGLKKERVREGEAPVHGPRHARRRSQGREGESTQAPSPSTPPTTT